jgi:L-iditol 2-dehydrogenase
MTQPYQKPAKMPVPGIFSIPNDIRVVEVDTPIAGRDGLVLKVDSCGLCNSEVKTILRGHPFFSKLPPPLILGHEFSGRVIEMGPEVEGVKLGERFVVQAMLPCGYCHYCRQRQFNLCEHSADTMLIEGGFAPYVYVPAYRLRERIIPVPDNVTSDQAALAEPVCCVLRGIERANIAMGDTVVVVGAGFMGLLLTNAAVARGALKVISVDQYPHRLALAKTMGASETVNFLEVNSVQAVRDLTAGRGADVVIEATGNPKAYEDAFAMAGSGGRVVFFGGTPSGSKIELDPNRIHYGEVDVVGTYGGTPALFERAMALMGTGKLQAEKLITHRIKAIELKKAVDLAITKEPIKILLTHD